MRLNIVLALLVIVGCTSSREYLGVEVLGPRGSSANAEAAVMELVLHCLLSSEVEKGKVFLKVTLRGREVPIPPALLDRISSYDIDVRPEAEWVPGAGLMCGVELLRWDNPKEIKVLGWKTKGGPLDGSGFETTAHWSDGAWRLEKGGAAWIS